MREWAFVFAILLGASILGCGGGGSVAGQPCQSALDCAPAADAACIDGSCLVFSDTQGYGSAVVDLSFARDIPAVPSSGKVWFIDTRRAAGAAIGCADIMNGSVVIDDQQLNPLTSQPKYLVFNCCGTYFPDNLIQFVRPSNSVLAIAQGYERLEAQGAVLAKGCTEGITITKDQTLSDLVISLEAI